MAAQEIVVLFVRVQIPLATPYSTLMRTEALLGHVRLRA